MFSSLNLFTFIREGREPQQIRNVTDFFTVGGDLRLFEQSDLMDRYFEWFTYNRYADEIKEFAKKYGVEFLYRDFRPNFRQGNNLAKEKQFYMQKSSKVYLE